MTEWFVIKNVKQFTNQARAIVYNNFGTTENESSIDKIIDSKIQSSDQIEFDKVLSYKQALIIIKQIARKQKNKITSKTRYMVNDALVAKILEDLNARMVSNILAELVSKGLVESAYDNELNDFVFWAKKDNENTQ